VRHNAAINRYYQLKRAKTNGVVAIKTVAHKLARACYHIYARAPTSMSPRPSLEPNRGGGGDLATWLANEPSRPESGTATAPHTPWRIDRDRDAPAIGPAKGWTAPAWRRATDL
jgi:hypothetical protein